MTPPDLEFALPNWKVPPNRPDQISVEAWLEWIEENRCELIRRGKITQIRRDPLRRQVDVRFVLP